MASSATGLLQSKILRPCAGPMGVPCRPPFVDNVESVPIEYCRGKSTTQCPLLTPCAEAGAADAGIAKANIAELIIAEVNIAEVNIAEVNTAELHIVAARAAIVLAFRLRARGALNCRTTVLPEAIRPLFL